MDEVFLFFAKRDGATPLHFAALTGNVELIQELVKNGSELGLANIYGETPLHYACIARSMPSIDFLCKQGSPVNAQSNFGATPIHYAVLAYAPPDVIQLLCGYNANLSVFSEPIDSFFDSIFLDYHFIPTGTPLYWATTIENFEAINILLDNGADPFSGNPLSSNRPAWQLAFSYQSSHMIEMMFSTSRKLKRPFPNADEIVPHLSNKETSPLSILLHAPTTRGEFTRRVCILLANTGIEIDEMGIIIGCMDMQITPEDVVTVVENAMKKKGLQSGVQYGNYRYHYPNTGNILIVPISLESLLVSSLFSSSIEIVRLLLRRIGNLASAMAPELPHFEGDGGGSHMQTYFHALCYYSNRTEHELAHLVECLIARGADKGTKSSVGSLEVTALEQAANFHQFPAMRAFLDYGIGDVFKALIGALSSNAVLYLPVVDLLLEKCPEILLQTLTEDPYFLKFGFIPMEKGVCALSLFMGILCSLNELDRNDAMVERKMRRIQKAAEIIPGGLAAITDAVHWRDFTGSTLLHWAASNGNRVLCEILLDIGAPVNGGTGHLGFSQLATFPQLETMLQDTLAPLDELESPSTNSSSAQTTGAPPPQDALADAFLGLKWPTPLDLAFGRDWARVLHLQNFFKSDMIKMHNLGGDHKQRKSFKQRTDDVVLLLCQNGGKRSNEL